MIVELIVTLRYDDERVEKWKNAFRNFDTVSRHGEDCKVLAVTGHGLTVDFHLRPLVSTPRGIGL